MHFLSRIFLFLILPLFVGGILVLNFIKFEARAQNVPSWFTSEQVLSIREKQYEVLEINLTFDKNAVEKFKTDSINKRIGFAPKLDAENPSYTLELLDKDGNSISKTAFEPPVHVHGVPPQPGQEAKAQPGVELDKVKFTLTVALDSAHSFRILDSSSNELSKQEIPIVEIKKGSGKFKSIKGSDVNNVQNSSLNLIENANAQTTSNGFLDIAYIGDDYTNMDQFSSDAQRSAQHMVTYEPFKSRSSQIYFHQVENTSDLGCYYFQDRLILCDYSSIYQAVNRSGVPYDKIIVLLNSSRYGGSGGEIAMSYNGSEEEEVVVHEFGHSLGFLLDEYTVYAGDGPIDGQVQVNCLKGIPPASGWSNMVGRDDYAQGCNYQNWYRPSSKSIMIDLLSPWFNSPSQKALRERINYFAGNFSDPVSPTVDITSPSNQSYVNENFTVNATASDNLGVSQVQFWVNGVLMSSKYVGPYAFTYQVNPVDNQYNVQVKALDTAGNIATDSVILLADSDADGFNNKLESFLGTNPNKKCANTSVRNDETGLDAWPLDFDDNQTANTLDIGKFIPVLDGEVGDGKYKARYDLNMDGKVNTIDIGKYVLSLNKTCL